MNLAWTCGDFVSPKLHRPDFATYPIIGRLVNSRVAMQSTMQSFFSRSHHAAFSKKTGSHLGPLQKHLAISPIPLPSVAAP